MPYSTVVFIYSTTPPNPLLRTIITDDVDYPATAVAQRAPCVTGKGEAAVVMPYQQYLQLTVPIEADPTLLAAISQAVVIAPPPVGNVVS